MNVQSTNLMPRDMFVNLWIRSVVWGAIYGSAIGALVIVFLFNGYGLLVSFDVVPSNDSFDEFVASLKAVLLYIPFEAVAGVLIGGGLGVLQGVFTGVIIGCVTVMRFDPPTCQEDVYHYRRIMTRLSIVGAFLITLLVSAGYIVVQMTSVDAALRLRDLLLVSLIVFPVTYASWRASQRVCHWYAGMERVSPENSVSLEIPS